MLKRPQPLHHENFELSHLCWCLYCECLFAFDMASRRFVMIGTVSLFGWWHSKSTWTTPLSVPVCTTTSERHGLHRGEKRTLAKVALLTALWFWSVPYPTCPPSPTSKLWWIAKKAAPLDNLVSVVEITNPRSHPLPLSLRHPPVIVTFQVLNCLHSAVHFGWKPHHQTQTNPTFIILVVADMRKMEALLADKKKNWSSLKLSWIRHWESPLQISFWIATPTLKKGFPLCVPLLLAGLHVPFNAYRANGSCLNGDASMAPTTHTKPKAPPTLPALTPNQHPRPPTQKYDELFHDRFCPPEMPNARSSRLTMLMYCEAKYPFGNYSQYSDIELKNSTGIHKSDVWKYDNLIDVYYDSVGLYQLRNKSYLSR